MSQCHNQASAIARHLRHSKHYVSNAQDVSTRQTSLLSTRDTQLDCPECPRRLDQTSPNSQDEKYTNMHCLKCLRTSPIPGSFSRKPAITDRPVMNEYQPLNFDVNVNLVI